MQHSRSLLNEKQQLIVVKADSLYVGDILVPPYTPVLYNTACTNFAVILPPLPAYDCFEIQEERNGKVERDTWMEDLVNIYKMDRTDGSYRWRIRGHMTENSRVSPWSEWSATLAFSC